MNRIKILDIQLKNCCCFYRDNMSTHTDCPNQSSKWLSAAAPMFGPALVWHRAALAYFPATITSLYEDKRICMRRDSVSEGYPVVISFLAIEDRIRGNLPHIIVSKFPTILAALACIRIPPGRFYLHPSDEWMIWGKCRRSVAFEGMYPDTMGHILQEFQPSPQHPIRVHARSVHASCEWLKRMHKTKATHFFEIIIYGVNDAEFGWPISIVLQALKSELFRWPGKDS